MKSLPVVTCVSNAASLAPIAPGISTVFQVVLLQILIAHLLSLLLYNGILRVGDKSSSSFVVALGVVLPVCVAFPFIAMEVLDIRNVFIRLGLMPIPLIVGLRTLEGRVNCQDILS